MILSQTNINTPQLCLRKSLCQWADTVLSMHTVYPTAEKEDRQVIFHFFLEHRFGDISFCCFFSLLILTFTSIFNSFLQDLIFLNHKGGFQGELDRVVTFYLGHFGNLGERNKKNKMFYCLSQKETGFLTNTLNEKCIQEILGLSVIFLNSILFEATLFWTEK